jgi:hypothetical protein
MHVRERLEVATRREAEGTCKDGAKSLLARYIMNLSHMFFLTARTGLKRSTQAFFNLTCLFALQAGSLACESYNGSTNCESY